MVIKKIIDLSPSQDNWEDAVKSILQEDSQNIHIHTIRMRGPQAILEGEQVSHSMNYEIL